MDSASVPQILKRYKETPMCILSRAKTSLRFAKVSQCPAAGSEHTAGTLQAQWEMKHEREGWQIIELCGPASLLFSAVRHELWHPKGFGP